MINATESGQSGADRDASREANKIKFSDKKIRQAFVRKVFLIVTYQLIITCLIIAPLILYEPLRQKISTDFRIYLASFVIFFVVNLVIICCNAITRSFPQNYILLGVLTVSTAVWVGCISAKYNAVSVLVAIGLTAIICFLLALFATQTLIDFTAYIGLFFVFAVGLMLLSVVFIFWRSELLTWIIIYSGAVLCSFYIIVYIQMIIGGKNKYSLSPEDYILAATLLYVEIVYLFVYVLMIVGNRN